MGEDKNLIRPNVERPIFQDFEISNIKVTKVKFFDFFYLIFFLNCTNTQNIG